MELELDRIAVKAINEDYIEMEVDAEEGEFQRMTVGQARQLVLDLKALLANQEVPDNCEIAGVGSDREPRIWVDTSGRGDSQRLDIECEVHRNETVNMVINRILAEQLVADLESMVAELVG